MNLPRISFASLALCLALFAAPSVSRATSAAAVARWQDARYGVIIQWGPVSQKGLEISYARKTEVASPPLESSTSPSGYVAAPNYDNYYQTFNPTNFDASAWVKMFKDAGVKYVIVTAKHQDGFCMFNTQLPSGSIHPLVNGTSVPYSIMSTPFGRDVLKEIADACHAAGLLFGIYYSPRDWHHPNYGGGYSMVSGSANLTSSGNTTTAAGGTTTFGTIAGNATTYTTYANDAYLTYMNGQLRELLTNYGTVDALWFDKYGYLGNGTSFWHIPETFNLIKSIQPDVLVNDGLVALSNSGNPTGVKDFSNLGYINKFGSSKYAINDNLESINAPTLTHDAVNGLNNAAWSYHSGSELPESRDVLNNLVDCVIAAAPAGGNIFGANMALTIGPDGTGTIPSNQQQLLTYIGTWLSTNGEGVYGTRSGPYKTGEYGGTTRKGNTVYVHVKTWPMDGAALVMPKFWTTTMPTLTGARLLRGGAVTATQSATNGISITVAEADRDPVDTVVALDFNSLGSYTNVAGPSLAGTGVVPNPLISRHMVLQSGAAVPIWGTAPANLPITVKFRTQVKTTTADANGNWLVMLDPLPPGGPDTLTINLQKIPDVLLGEVWLGSGQSNMAQTVSQYLGYANQLADYNAAPYQQVRLYNNGKWMIASQYYIYDFSAQLFPFSLRLYRGLNRPVGVIMSAVPSTPSVKWMSLDAYNSDPVCSQVPLSATDKTNIGVHYTSYIKPLQPYAIRGVLWDQGEAGTGLTGTTVRQYNMMGALIRGWRKDWGQGNFPFIYVQKVNGGGCAWCRSNPLTPDGDDVAALPAALPTSSDYCFTYTQMMNYPNTFMSTSSDLGYAVHPSNKTGYGYRGADVALGAVYGQPVEYYGPVYESHTIEGSNVRLRFTHVGQGLAFKTGGINNVTKLQGFTIAGANKTFYWANAVIDGVTVVVSHPSVPAPAYVQYAWCDPKGADASKGDIIAYNPTPPVSDTRAWANLFNLDGMPAVPFAIAVGVYSAWKQQYFTSGNYILVNGTLTPLTDPVVSGDTADPFGKGMTNLQQCAAGLNPLDPQDTFTTTMALSAAGAGVSTVGRAGRIYAFEHSADLATWEELNRTDILSADKILNWTDPVPLSPKAFYRIRAILP